VLAGVTTTPSTKPKVSTRKCRLRLCEDQHSRNCVNISFM
jgi:hypothetical protein